MLVRVDDHDHSNGQSLSHSLSHSHSHSHDGSACLPYQCSQRRSTSTSTQRLKIMEPSSTILSLPEEVLYIIFSHLRRDQVYRGLFDWTRYDDRSKLQTIKAARLVCRLFNQIASPLLCPRLRLRLDHASLEFVDKVSKS